MFLVRHVILQDADLAHVVTLWVGAHQNKLLLCQVGGHRRSGIGDIIFLVCYASSCKSRCPKRRVTRWLGAR